MLSSLNFRLAAMKKESVTNTSILRSRIEAIQQVIRDTASVVQNFARDLRPSLLDDLGLLPAIRSYGSSFSSRTGIKIIYKLCQLNASIIPEISTVLFRIIQEALTNVERHARASQVEISLRKTPRSLWLKISDDGRGFDVSRYYNGHRPKKRLSLGLLGMRERAEMIGGSFNIQSAKGTPTVIEVRVPVFETESIEPEPNKKTNVKFPT
jgi:signal transduction histidine kinase